MTFALTTDMMERHSNVLECVTIYHFIRPYLKVQRTVLGFLWHLKTVTRSSFCLVHCVKVKMPL